MIQSIKSLDRILKGQVTDLPALRRGTLEIPVGGLLMLLVLLGGVYGVCMGTFAVAVRWGVGEARFGFLQMAYSAAKVPLLFVLTLAITFPSLYVFNALVGCRLLFATVLRLLVASMGVTLAVLASFGTIIAFFSLCTTSYPFMVLLNVVTFALAGVLGMYFLLQTLHRLSVVQESAAWEAAQARPSPPIPAGESLEVPSPPPLPPSTAIPSSQRIPNALDSLRGQNIGSRVRMVFGIWAIVFGLVGSQMGWVLRPFVGNPEAPVTFFRSREGSFFQAVIDKVEDLSAGRNPVPRSGRWQ